MPATKVIVQYGDGSAATSVPVSLSFFCWGVSDTVYTDSHGVAVIEHSTTGSAEVIVDGRVRERISAPTTTAVTIS